MAPQSNKKISVQCPIIDQNVLRTENLFTTVLSSPEGENKAHLTMCECVLVCVHAHGFRLGSGLVRMVRVKGWIIHYAYESPHKIEVLWCLY